MSADVVDVSLVEQYKWFTFNVEASQQQQKQTENAGF